MKSRLFALFVAGGFATSGLVAAGAIIGAGGAGATTISLPAPPAAGSGVALQVGPIASVGTSSTGAGAGGASASAVPVSVMGHPVLGGTQTGTGSQSGALVDTGTTPLGQVQVAPWKVAVTQTSSRSSASSSSAAAHAVVINPNVVEVDVLKSSSNSTYTGPLSVGQAVSDGAVVRVGGPNGLVIDVLHSEADSSGHGRTYLLGIGNTTIGENTVGTVCNMAIPSLLKLTCLSVEGGVGGLTASDLTAVVGQVPGLTANALLSGATGGTASTAGASSTLGQAESTLASSGPATATVHSAHSLAFTGFALRILVAAALALLMVGALVLAATRRTTSVTI